MARFTPDAQMPPAVAREYLIRYQKTKDVSYRNAVITGNAGMLIDLANKPDFRFGSVDVEDLRQEAFIGFSVGLDNYNTDSKAAPANYARFYAKGALFAYVRLNGHNIPIPDNCHRAYKIMLKRAEAAMHEHESENINYSSLIHDQWPYQQAGALAIMHNRYDEPEDLEIPVCGFGYSRMDISKIMQCFLSLPEPQQSICRSHFGMSDETLPELQKRTGYSKGTIDRIIQGSIQRIRNEVMPGENAPMVAPARERIFTRSTQVNLFSERNNPRKAPKAPRRLAAPVAIR